ncbi:MAG: anthranilate phosphoribosyltransferase [bacterium]
MLTQGNERLAGFNSTPDESTRTQVDVSLRTFLSRLLVGQSLGRHEAEVFLGALLDGEATDAQIGAALVALAIKGETVTELVGMASAMRSRAVRIHSRYERFIDTAGTGSSNAKTFNVSTAAAFVIAGAGLPVAKHGNRAASSRTGSADVLTALGVQVSASPEISEQCLNELGICFMFAPLYHGTTARVAGVRRQLGVRTVFNLLGPLTNPAGAPSQIVGVWHESMVHPLAQTLAALGTKRSWVVHGLDGLDEITLASKTLVAEAASESVRTFEIGPEDFGLRLTSLEAVRGGDAADSARLIRDVLRGERRDAARDLIIINASAALFVGGAAASLNEARCRAEQSIDEGKAQAKLDELIRATNQ